jgi:hypothetical protein
MAELDLGTFNKWYPKTMKQNLSTRFYFAAPYYFGFRIPDVVGGA